MANGRLQAVDIAALTEQIVYKTDDGDAANTATVTVNLVNRSATDTADFTLGVCDTNTLGDEAFILEKNMQLEPNGVFERTGIFVGPGQFIIVRSDVGGMSCAIWGSEVQASTSNIPAGTSYTIPVTYNVTADQTSINEGNQVNFIVRTTGVADATSLAYTITGIATADINGASLTGNITITNNIGILTVQSTLDNSTEGDETLTFTLTVNSQSVAVTLLDTSLDPVTPPDPVDSLPTPYLHYKNEYLSDNFSNGASINTWANEGSAGTGYNLTSGGNGSRPTKYTNNQGGVAYPYADFSGSQTLRFSNSSNLQLFASSQNNNFTIFIVYYDAYNNNTFGWMGNVAGSNASSIGEWSGDDTFYMIFSNDGRPYNFGLQANSDAFNQQGVRFSSAGSTNGYIYRWAGNSSSIDTVTSNWGPYGSEMNVTGIGYTRYSYNYGYLYEFIYYDEALSNDDVTTIRQYLANKFPNTNVAS